MVIVHKSVVNPRPNLKNHENQTPYPPPKQKAIAWACQIIAAIIFIQTLFFKFTAAPESVYIFTKLGVEPFGRIGSGVIELIAALLLLTSGTAVLGALLGLATIGGAILSHLTVLGISVNGDGGMLFALAVIVAVCLLIVLWLRRKQIPFLNL